MLEKLPPRRCRQLEVVSLAIGAVAVGYLMWAACSYTSESWEFNDISQGLLPMPLWIPQLGMALGTLVLLIAFVDEWVLELRGQRQHIGGPETRHE